MCHRVSRVKLKFKVIEAAKAIEIHRRLSGSDKDSFTKLTPATFGRGLGIARVLTPVRPDDAALLPESFKSANAVHGGEEGGVLPLLALSFISPFDRVAGAKCVEGKFSRYRENSLSLPLHREGETEVAT